MSDIKKVAVIGSGVMGASIAAHIANSGTEVLLFDVVKEGENRNQIVVDAIANLQKVKPAPLTDKKNAKLIKPLNLEDDLEKLKEVDWIIEVIIEDLKIKKELYKKIDKYAHKNTIISSNTSTLPLKKLTEDCSKNFKERFLITHFFNPPRYMRLLELVVSLDVKKKNIEKISQFIEVNLGKGIVLCKDTAGFIANRIGCFWLQSSLNSALDLNISVEKVDAVMSKPIGVPKTGVFGLMDLIGIDLLPLIAKSFAENLPKKDEFLKIYKEHDVITKMIADGYVGRKGKGGFYRLNEERKKEAKNLQNGEYSLAQKSGIAKIKIKDILEKDSEISQYAWKVLSDLFIYTANIAAEIADDILAIDEAMRLGYNWKYGVFELIDLLSVDYVVKRLADEKREIPALLKIAADSDNKSFYKVSEEEGKKYHLAFDGKFKEILFDKNSFMLSEVKLGKKPVIKNGSAALWDIGSGIACLEFTSKMNSLDPDSLSLIQKAIEIVQKDFKGLVIANDSDNFCVGANIGILLFAANTASWKLINEIIKNGQDTFMALKYAPFPVVAAPTGMALGGGCEMLLHSDAIVAHIELYSGLVEVGVGLIPGWGGCKELIYRGLRKRAQKDSLARKLGSMFSFISPVKTLNTMPALEPAFRNISTANVSTSAVLAEKIGVLNENSEIVMNRKHLLAKAKAKCLEMAQDYQAPKTYPVSLPGKTAQTAFKMAVRSFVKSGKATEYDAVIAEKLGMVISGGNTSITKEISEQDLLDLEREIFVELVKDERTLARIEYMLDTGKPLRN